MHVYIYKIFIGLMELLDQGSREGNECYRMSAEWVHYCWYLSSQKAGIMLPVCKEETQLCGAESPLIVRAVETGLIGFRVRRVYVLSP